MFNFFRNKYDIIISAHDFGLGPTSIISQTLKNQRKYKFGLIGNKNQEDFISKQGFKVKLLADQYDYLNSKNIIKATVSCFDPMLVFSSWKRGIPVLYIDNLFWFWDFEEKKLQKTYDELVSLKEINNQDFDAKVKEIVDFNSHLPFVLAHLFSTESLIQRFGQTVKKRLKFIKKFNQNISLFGALVPEKKYLNKTKSHKPVIYVQLGGMLNPNTGLDFSKKYVNYVAQALDQINKKDIYKVIFKVNPVFESIKRNYKNLEIITNLSFRDHVSLVKNCDFLVLQPGQNGIYESVYFSKNIFLLPEQTTSHTVHVKEMIKNGFVADQHMFFDFYDVKADKEDTDYLVKGLNQFRRDKAKLINKIEEFLHKDKKLTTKEITTRYQVTKKLLGGFGGNETLIKTADLFFKKFVEN
ncbi:MAG: hypothetical protein IT416_01705 [Candidatus Pacebacteria bacterium]|nr:hypothetical protein [Candidatus Paceibacterota bacterium]